MKKVRVKFLAGKPNNMLVFSLTKGHVAAMGLSIIAGRGCRRCVESVKACLVVDAMRGAVVVVGESSSCYHGDGRLSQCEGLYPIAHKPLGFGDG